MIVDVPSYVFVVLVSVSRMSVQCICPIRMQKQRLACWLNFSVDGILKYIFSQKIGFDIPYTLSS